MAIREVLVSFTFEQQRQMLNLIGTDVGDASLLLTPTNVVVTAINEIITGDVDLTNQTIGMDDGTLASPSLYWDTGQGFYKVDANKLGLTTSLAVTGNLEVDGDITFRAGSGTGGTLTFGDLDTDNIIINADVQSSIVPDSTANYNLGTLNKQWNNLWIDGTASIDTLEVDLDTTLTGELAVNSGIIKVDPSTVTTATIFNNYIDTAQVLMDAIDITLGSNISNSTLLVRSTIINTPNATLTLFDTTVDTINAFGAAEDVTMGFSTFGTTGVNSNFNIRSDDTVLDGDLNVNGGEILSSQNTFDLLIANDDIRIGAANGAGETVINNSLKVTENVNLENSGTNITIKDNTANSLLIKEGANTYITFQTTDTSERVIVYKDLYVVGNLDISGSTTTIDTTTLTVEDKNIELGTSGSPTDALADGGGITLKGTTDKTITYNNTSGLWETNIGFDIAGTLDVTGAVVFDSTVTATTFTGNATTSSSLIGPLASGGDNTNAEQIEKWFKVFNGITDDHYEGLVGNINTTMTWAGTIPANGKVVRVNYASGNSMSGGQITLNSTDVNPISGQTPGAWVNLGTFGADITSITYTRGSVYSSGGLVLCAIEVDGVIILDPIECNTGGTFAGDVNISDGLTHISNNTTDSLHWNSYNCHLLHTDDTDFTTLIENSHDSNPNCLGLHMSDAAPNNSSSMYLQCYDTSGGTTTVRAKITSDGTISDSKGDLRNIPQNIQAGSYTLVASDAGKHIFASGNINTGADNVFSVGDAVTIVNNTASDLTITRAINTMYNSAAGDVNSATYTLAARGMATILFVAGDEARISGGGLS